MKKLLSFTIILLFFATIATADTGVTDCGVTYNGTSYSSFQDFFSRGLPLNPTVGQIITWTQCVRNNNSFPVEGIAFDCSIGSSIFDETKQASASANYRNYGQNPVTVSPGQTGNLVFSFTIGENYYKLENSTSNGLGCTLVNQQGTLITSAWNGSFSVSTSKIVNLNIKTIPAATASKGNILVSEMEITNKGTQTIIPSKMELSTVYSRPCNWVYISDNCSFNEGGTSIAPGEKKTLPCAHTINFNEGVAEHGINLFIETGSESQTFNMSKGYSVSSGYGNCFNSLSPLNVYGNPQGQLSIIYKAQSDTGSAPTCTTGCTYYAFVDGQKTDSWVSNNAEETKTLNYTLANALSATEHSIVLMMFDGTAKSVIGAAVEPFPPGDKTPTSFPYSNFFSYTGTNFYVPRILQPDDRPYYPVAQSYNVETSTLQLGIRNLSDVSPYGKFVNYTLSLVSGDYSKVIDIDEGCDGSIERTNWQDITYNDQINDIKPEEDFAGLKAPGLNKKVCMKFNGTGTYKFNLKATNDVSDTTFDERNLVEDLTVGVNEPTDLTMTATENIDAGSSTSIHTETTKDRQPIIKIFDSKNSLLTTISPETPTKSFDTTYKIDKEGSYRIYATIATPCTICNATVMVNVEKKKQSNVPETNLAIIVLVSLIVLVATRKK